ncbi:hypothetical protein VTK56DRAFT_5304 [Thermocarpiscus australiensis]
MDAGGRTDGTPAPYGRACTNCARAKCRCIYRSGSSGGTGCERCHRLKKECIPSVSVRKRNGRRTQVSRAAQLEAKLEDLVTLLRRQTAPTDKALSPAGNDTAGEVSAITPTISTLSNSSRAGDSPPRLCDPAILSPQQPDCAPGRVPPAPIARGSLLGCIHEPPVMTPLSPPIEPVSLPLCIYQPTPIEAAESLRTFRKQMLIFLPFMHLPDAVTSERLREIYPFLWFSIMTATCKNVDRRLAMSESSEKFLAQKMVVEHVKSLDLLLGLLVILGWTHYYIRKESRMLTLLASLAKSLVFDLGLNKNVREPCIAAYIKASCAPAPKETTLEERRAVLACFVLTSQISHAMKRLDALAWTLQMEEFLESLSQHGEWEGDDLLVAQVKTQLVVEELTRATSQSPDNVAPAYVLSALQTQLRNIKLQLPFHLQQNDAILSHISYTELAIHEATLARPKAPVSGTTSDLQRYEAMEGCLSAARDWFDRHFAIPNHMYARVPLNYWCTMAHCLWSIYRLSSLDDPGWDRRAVRSKIDWLAVCDKLVARCTEVVAQRQLESGPSPMEEEDGFAKLSKALQSVRERWAAEQAAADGSPGGPGSTSAAEPLLDGSGAGGLNMPLFQPGESDLWIAGLFDVEWEF